MNQRDHLRSQEEKQYKKWYCHHKRHLGAGFVSFLDTVDGSGTHVLGSKAGQTISQGRKGSNGKGI